MDSLKERLQWLINKCEEKVATVSGAELEEVVNIRDETIALLNHVSKAAEAGLL